jgi:phosphate transport system permease protein
MPLYAPPPVSSLASPDLNPARLIRERRARINSTDKKANRALRLLAVGGGCVLFLALVAIIFLIVSGASQSYDKFGLGFIGHSTWIATISISQFGAWPFIFGTLVTAVCSVVLSTILGVAIGLFLALLAPRRVAAVVGPLVELLAAIPSVILGLIGIVLICPFIAHDIEPWLHTILGWTQLFGPANSVGNSVFAAILVLTIMVVPIIAALSRDLFATVPRDLRDGAEALGATRWEMIRAVVFPTTRSGVIAACVLGFGRAVGEAIAVEQVIGSNPSVHADLFQGGDTLAARIAAEFASPQSTLHASSLYYLGAILLVIVLATLLLARWISGDFKSSTI